MRAKSSNWKTGCSVEAALSVIGGIWKPVILFHLLERKMRFGELSRLVPNATQRKCLPSHFSSGSIQSVVCSRLSK
jgi:DNA-binding HxlR family transcriptional regulator